jgi:hypothetical protein
MEYAMLRLPHPERLSLRQFFMLAYEEIVAEHRAAQLDYGARVEFTGEGESIDETRTIVERQYLDPDEVLVKAIEDKRAEAALRMSAEGLVELD